MILYKIQECYERDHSLYYHVHALKITQQSGEMVKVFDTADGLTFWIEYWKLEPIPKEENQ